MMPGDPVVGGTVLRRPAIQSPNYSQGSTGWTVNADGSAEFNNLTIRGTFDGNDFILSSSGFFLYSGTPAAGSLLFSVTPAGTTADGFGNAVPNPGATSYANDSTFWSAINIGDGVVSWYEASSEAGPWTAEAGIGFNWNSSTGGGLNVTAPAGSDWTGDLDVAGNVTVTLTLTVGGTDVGATLSSIISALSGASTSTNGLPNGTITGTSGSASAGTAHTHGGGSYSVSNGQHHHTLPVV